MRRFAEIARDERRLRDWVRAHPPVLVGRAWRELRRFFDEYPLAELPLGAGWWTRYEARDCAIDFAGDTMWVRTTLTRASAAPPTARRR